MGLLDDTAIGRALSDLDGWRREGDALCRDLRFPSFMDAIAFVGRVAAVAEDADHHPELSIRYRDVAIRSTTNDADGITERDVALAHAIDRVVRAVS